MVGVDQTKENRKDRLQPRISSCAENSKTLLRDGAAGENSDKQWREGLVEQGNSIFVVDRGCCRYCRGGIEE
ncbi:hypothetical protein Bpfe_014926 [Biomphalaria pfeifferi]|uniref:Uncharacterized protein n=1 Tax=Biomphalaria pfeifferi TaxID=112525 RepID=A0AAD8BJV4_BIOPF|nr:hypothetical protein Bpfe_014926 [Biomphalaria pfeifferi]